MGTKINIPPFWKIIGLLSLIINSAMAGGEHIPQPLNYSSRPLLIDAPNQISDAEAGSIGCVIASVAVGVSMIYLMGGISPALAIIEQPLTPSIVLEGSAALAFVFSSACYIGVALAPITVSPYYNEVPKQLVRSSTRPLFAPGELWAISQGRNAPQQQATVPQTVGIPQQQIMVVPRQQSTDNSKQPP
ncbi:hypothetical protein TI05_06575 [Achromatium sp. WMS3]|nr:hypothetical protein TI05_06575 [Achromatium sp. WMS3]